MNSNNETLFSEKQRFGQKWIWAILIGANLIFFYGVFYQVFQRKSFDDNSMSNMQLLIASGLMLLFTLAVLTLKLETYIKKDGIYVRFFPFHLTLKKYSWDNIQRFSVRQYDPITEYGGWGFRFGFLTKGMAFNVSGNKGIQLVLKNGSRLLIGTNKPDEASETLKKLEQRSVFN
nr:DUF6141 family protein [uncultured Pedobacter sp.]